MPIVTFNQLKSYFESGDYPKSSEYVDFIDTVQGLYSDVQELELSISISDSQPNSSQTFIWYDTLNSDLKFYNGNSWVSLTNIDFSDAYDYTDFKIGALLNSAPPALDTLNELAAALGDDPNFATTIIETLGELELSVEENIANIENLNNLTPGVIIFSNITPTMPYKLYMTANNPNSTLYLSPNNFEIGEYIDVTTGSEGYSCRIYATGGADLLFGYNLQEEENGHIDVFAGSTIRATYLGDDKFSIIPSGGVSTYFSQAVNGVTGNMLLRGGYYDKGVLYLHNSTQSATVTVGTFTGINNKWKLGDHITLINTGVNPITFTGDAAAGVTVNSAGGLFTLAEQWAAAQLICIGRSSTTTDFVLVGRLE